jgi:hypothetical protein
MAGVTTTVTFEDHGAGIGAVKQAPLPITGDPLSNMVTVEVEDAFLILRRSAVMVDRAVLLAEAFLESMDESSLTNTVTT